MSRRPQSKTILTIALLLLVGFNAGYFLPRFPSQSLNLFNLVPGAFALETPANYLSFQGQLTDPSGVPITTTNTLTLSLYDHPSAGNLVYNETQSVTPDSRGIFYVLIGLGAGNGVPAGSQSWPPSFSQAYYLAVRVGLSGAYLSPRITVTQAPYTLDRAAAPVLTQSTSAAAPCTINVLTTLEGGFTTPLTYTTSALSSGNLYLTTTFTVSSPATSGLTSKWQVIYGTGSAPACDTAPSGATTVGQQYTIQTQAAAVGSWGQSIAVVITGLIPNTAYWFDVQVSDSTAAAWIYSKQTLAISDVLSATNPYPSLKETDSSASPCTISSVSANLAADLGGGMSYKTLPSGVGSGNVKVTISFNVQAPTTATALTSKWTFYWTTTNPTCAAAPTGPNAIGKQYTVENSAITNAMIVEQSEAVVIQGLSAATTYYFDVEVTDSTVGSWIYSAPTIAISEEPVISGSTTANNVVYPLSAQTAACGTTASATRMAGLREFYTLTSSSTGNIYGSLSVNVLATGTIAAGSTTAIILAYADVTATALPACNATPPVGTIVGNSYTSETVAAVAFSWAQTIQFVITGLLAGHTYWFDLQVTNAGATYTSGISNPTLTITDIQQANIPHVNLIFEKGNAPSCASTATAIQMGGMAVLPVTTNPPMEYQTTSYGTGNVRITFTFVITPTAAVERRQFLLAYGLVTDGTANPACAAAVPGGATAVGNTYTWSNQVAAVANVGYGTATVVIPGLSKGTMYWFDFEVTDSTLGMSGSAPQIEITEAV